MDFVVVGLGLGTLAILSGVLISVWTAGRWERSAARATTPEDAAHDGSVAAGRRGAGQALIGAGVAVLIATIGALAGSLDDQIGAIFVTTTATVAALGLLVWAYFHRSRNPLPPRRRMRTESKLQLPAGSWQSEDEGREEAPSGPEARTAELFPTDIEPAAAADSAEQDPSIAPLPIAASDLEVEPESIEADEVDGAANDAPEQSDLAVNRAIDAPLAGREYQDDWEGRRDRKS